MFEVHSFSMRPAKVAQQTSSPRTHAPKTPPPSASQSPKIACYVAPPLTRQHPSPSPIERFASGERVNGPPVKPHPRKMQKSVPAIPHGGASLGEAPTPPRAISHTIPLSSWTPHHSLKYDPPMSTPPLTPAAFVAKWKRAKLSERAASQEHFLDLCRLLEQPTPAEHDPTGSEYTFEKGITITIPGGLNLRGESGFADVWWNHKFGWEYKRQGKYKSLADAYSQLQRYREAPNNPYLLIVSDITTTEIHTNFTNAANVTHFIIALDGITTELAQISIWVGFLQWLYQNVTVNNKLRKHRSTLAPAVKSKFHQRLYASLDDIITDEAA